MFSKSIQRVSSKAIRMPKRFTSYKTGTEGATASTGSFGTKEKAIENQWARAHVSWIKPAGVGLEVIKHKFML